MNPFNFNNIPADQRQTYLDAFRTKDHRKVKKMIQQYDVYQPGPGCTTCGYTRRYAEWHKYLLATNHQQWLDGGLFTG